MTDEMKREAITKWLDYQVEVFKMRHKHRHIPAVIEGESELQICGVDDYIHIYKDIVLLADFMGFEVSWIGHDDIDDIDIKYPYEAQFEYKGVKFMGMYTQEGFDKCQSRR